MARTLKPCRADCCADRPCKVCRDRACKYRYQQRYTEDGRARASREKHQAEIIARQRRARGTDNPELFAKILEEQGGVCAICSSDKHLCLDHEHGTGRVRGVICRDCNLRVGNYYGRDGDRIERTRNGPFAERPELKLRALLYLNRDSLS